MAITPFKTFMAGEVLTASDLNSSFTRITDNGEDLGWPATKAKDLDGNELILDSDADSSLTVDTDDRADLKLQGVDAFRFDGTTASIVNGLDFVASATGSPVEINAQGSDTNIGIVLEPKGSGSVDINGSELILDADGDSSLTVDTDDVAHLRLQGFDAFTFDGDVASPVNGLTLASSATGNAPSIAATGSDTNLDLELTPKGTGELTVGGVRVFDTVYQESSADQEITSGTEVDITAFTAIDLPTTESVDTKTFEIHVSIQMKNEVNNLNLSIIRVYSGSTGDKDDTLLVNFGYALPASSALGAATISAFFRFTPATSSDTKIGLSAAGGDTFTVRGASNNTSALKIVQVA